MIRARVLTAQGVRELAEALPWADEGLARLGRGSPSRAFVIEGLDADGARSLAALLDSLGVPAIAGQCEVAAAGDPLRLTEALKTLKGDASRRETFNALSYALARWGEPAHDVQLPGGGLLGLSQRVHVMGIVNVTPDSFSDGGKFLDPEAAIEHGLTLAEEGADILDVGAESTRPGAGAVASEEELRRVLPVIEALAAKAGVPVSVDTMKASVAEAALEGGAQIVNDVSAGGDPAMFSVAAQREAAIILMHMRGEPRMMQKDVSYTDVVGEISGYLDLRAHAAFEAGVARERILIDPGFGFGKLVEHNLVLLRRLRELRCLGFPVVAGTSRKTFIGRVLDDLPVDDRLEGTAATVTLAVQGGAAIVRVHDVKAMSRVVRMVEAVAAAREPGA